MNNVPAALEEMDRAIAKLGAKGIQIFTNVNGRPLDEPEFFRIFERMSKTYDLPVWVHPTRTAKFADYLSEQKSKYEIWWLFGWPYETSAFMARLVFSGMFEKLPKLKIITHHLGAMAPFFVNRIGYGMDQFGSRTSDEDYGALLKSMKKRPVDYFKMFYGDTSVNGGEAAIRCGLDFYGVEQVLFGTDCPFDPRGRAALHPRDHQGARRHEAQAERPPPHLFRQRDADAQAEEHADDRYLGELQRLDVRSTTTACLGPAWFDEFAADLAGRLAARPGGDVLEIACGTGLVTRHLREKLAPGVRLVATRPEQGHARVRESQARRLRHRVARS